MEPLAALIVGLLALLTVFDEAAPNAAPLMPIHQIPDTVHDLYHFRCILPDGPGEDRAL